MTSRWSSNVEPAFAASTWTKTSGRITCAAHAIAGMAKKWTESTPASPRRPLSGEAKDVCRHGEPPTINNMAPGGVALRTRLRGGLPVPENVPDVGRNPHMWDAFAAGQFPGPGPLLPAGRHGRSQPVVILSEEGGGEAATHAGQLQTVIRCHSGSPGAVEEG